MDYLIDSSLATRHLRDYFAANARLWCIGWVSSVCLHLALIGLIVGALRLLSLEEVHLFGQRRVVSMQISIQDVSPALPAAAPSLTMEFQQELTGAPAEFNAEHLPNVKPRTVTIERRSTTAEVRAELRAEEVLETFDAEVTSAPLASRPLERTDRLAEARLQQVDVTGLRAAEVGRNPSIAQLPKVQIGIETTPARPLYNPQPIYPSEAVSEGLHGNVLLRLTISEKGKVTNVEVASSSGHAILDQAAIDAVIRWRFIAATRGGRPVSTSKTLPVRFHPS